jgi:photosystem II stability/assembly factor-like uncharacterized protein
MQKVHMRMVLSMPLAFCLCANLAAQRAIQSMKLLTPEVGWTATKEKLFWTTSGGARWKDITPKLDHKWQAISSVAFLDASTGWILLHCADNRDEKADDTCFEFASTANAGETWSVVHPKIVDSVANDSDVEDGLGFSGRSFLQFADSQHGWAILKKSTPVDFSTGVMLRTADGGQTWTQLKGDLPMAEDFHFATPKDGWIAGGPDETLFLTRDAGNAWVEVSPGVPPESKMPVDSAVSWTLPVFENPGRGFLMVRYSDGSDGDRSAVVLFSTEDLGRRWNFERVVPEIKGSTTILRDSVVIAARSELKREPQNERQFVEVTELSLYILGPDGNISSNTARIPSSAAGAMQLFFIGRDQGWVALSDRLFATRDAGKSWVDISPSGPPPPARVLTQVPAKAAPPQR